MTLSKICSFLRMLIVPLSPAPPPARLAPSLHSKRFSSLLQQGISQPLKNCASLPPPVFWTRAAAAFSRERTEIQELLHGQRGRRVASKMLHLAEQHPATARGSQGSRAPYGDPSRLHCFIAPAAIAALLHSSIAPAKALLLLAPMRRRLTQMLASCFALRALFTTSSAPPL